LNPATVPASPSRLTRRALEERIASFRGKRVLVVGDVILDRYLWGRATRVSPEAPVLVVDIEREELRLGGAANVAHNVRALGADPILIGVVGEDQAAADLDRLLRSRGVDPSGLVHDPSRRTTLKTRIIAHHQQVLRGRRGEQGRAHGRAGSGPLGPRGAGARPCGRGARERLRQVRRHPALLSKLLPALERQGVPSAGRSQGGALLPLHGGQRHHAERRRGGAGVGSQAQDRGRADRAGFGLREKLDAGSVLITRGEDGMSLFTAEGHTHFPDTRAQGVRRDRRGGHGRRHDRDRARREGLAPEACVLANHAAGIVVAQLGTATAAAEELVASLEDLPVG
jgi:D-beta-D-heptose 7-phosphate kinase/D-beta-D-heptose 1-phosphate adenosyltransferase